MVHPRDAVARSRHESETLAGLRPPRHTQQHPQPRRQEVSPPRHPIITPSSHQSATLDSFGTGRRGSRDCKLYRRSKFFVHLSTQATDRSNAIDKDTTFQIRDAPHTRCTDHSTGKAVLLRRSLAQKVPTEKGEYGGDAARLPQVLLALIDALKRGDKNIVMRYVPGNEVQPGGYGTSPPFAIP